MTDGRILIVPKPPPPTSPKLPPLGAALTGAAANGQSAVRGRKERANEQHCYYYCSNSNSFSFLSASNKFLRSTLELGERARGRLYPVDGVELFRSMDEFTESFLCQKCSLASIQTRCSGRFCSTFLSVTNKRGGNGDTAALPRLCTIDGFRFEIAQWQSLQKMQSTPRRRGKRRQKGNVERGREEITASVGVLRGQHSREEPRRVDVGRFDFLRKLQLFSRSICAPIRHEGEGGRATSTLFLRPI